MRTSRRWRTVVLGCMLAFSAFTGASVLPEDIDEIMRSNHEQRIEVVVEGDLPKLPDL